MFRIVNKKRDPRAAPFHTIRLSFQFSFKVLTLLNFPSNPKAWANESIGIYTAPTQILETKTKWDHPAVIYIEEQEKEILFYGKLHLSSYK